MNDGYRIEHRVSLGETSLVGSVYFARFLEWQGRCRERFLAEQAPGVLAALQSRELALPTLSCECRYEGELAAGDLITLTMRLRSLATAKLTLAFDYHRGEDRIASGSQQIGCRARQADGSWQAAPLPRELLRALLEHVADEGLTHALGLAIEL